MLLFLCLVHHPFKLMVCVWCYVGVLTSTYKSSDFHEGVTKVRKAVMLPVAIVIT